MKSISLAIVVLFLITMIPAEGNGLILDQNQGRPEFKYSQHNQIASGLVIIGNTSDSEFGLLSSRIGITNSRVLLSGNPSVENIGLFRSNVSGNFHKQVHIENRVIGTYFEVEDYSQEYNELERYKINISDTFVENDESFSSEFDFVKPGYNLFRNNNSYKMVEDRRSDSTAFILRNGFITDIELNDSKGDEIGRILSFRIVTNIFYFNTEDQKFLGALQTVDFGYGNILPQNIIEFLKRDQFNRNLAGGSLGERLLDEYKFENIEWIDAGYNETLGLNVYQGLYFISRELTSVILNQGNRNRPSLGLKQIDEDIETFQNELIDENIVNAFDESIIQQFENQLSQNVLEENGVTITSIIFQDPTSSNSTKTISNLENLYNENIFFITQLTAILIVTLVLIRKKKNS